jgi:hypothetical protein
MPKYDDDEFEKDEEQYEAPRRLRVVDDQDDDDDAPVRKASAPRASEPAPRRVIRGGWEGVKQLKSDVSDSSYAQRLKVSEEPIIVKFLEAAPYAAYRQHWVERTGQKSFTCIGNIDPKGCPLCDSGNRPSNKFAFNVVLLTPGEDPVLRSYEVGSRAIDQLKNFNDDPRQGPLPKHYWAISRSGKGATTATNHQLVKARDLEEEWGVIDLTEDMLNHFLKLAYTDEIVPIPTRSSLLGVIAEDE